MIDFVQFVSSLEEFILFFSIIRRKRLYGNRRFNNVLNFNNVFFLFQVFRLVLESDYNSIPVKGLCIHSQGVESSLIISNTRQIG